MSTGNDCSAATNNDHPQSRNRTKEKGDDDNSAMKRAAAEQLIKSYFYRLTDGCGVSGCDNEYCVSSGRPPTSKNDAAALALQLFQKKARLCEPLREVNNHRATTIDHPETAVKNHPVKEIPHLTEKTVLAEIEQCQKDGSFKSLVHRIGKVFSSSASLNKSFLLEPAQHKINIVSLDIAAVRRVYASLFQVGDSSVENSLLNSLATLSLSLQMDLRYKTPCGGPDFLNQFVIIMENTMLQSPEYLDQALPSFLKALSLLPVKEQERLVLLWKGYDKANLQRMLESLQQLITYKVLTGPSASSQAYLQDDEAIVSATKTLKLVYYASIMAGKVDVSSMDDGGAASAVKNSEDVLAKNLAINFLNCRKPMIDYSEFVNEALNEVIEVDHDFTLFKSEQQRFSFLNYNFILSTATKSAGLFFDNRVRMYSERRLTLLYSLVRGQPPTPYLRLKVRRDHIVDDALVNLEMVAHENPLDLKKQLYVEFEGEQGIDEGGVSKEFFQLIVESVFNPDYGMFTFGEVTRTYWFNPKSLEVDAQFTLIGLVLGLAIYNNVILDVPFPMVVYRKLCGMKGNLEDLHDSHPILAKSLQELLDYEGDVKADFMRTFRIDYTDVFGTVHKHDLKDGAEELELTCENRKEYVQLYTDFLLNKSVERQFNAFRRGFDMVVDESPLKTFFRPEEIELLICGSTDFDFDALEKSTEYDGGLAKESPLIRWFWDIVHGFTVEQKKQLLMFTTGSDRVPVGGLAKLKLIIAKNGPDSDRLPTAHTCYNVLLLPEYTNKEKLQERLLKAITHAKGFGML